MQRWEGRDDGHTHRSLDTQALLASMFLFAGAAKLVMTPEQMAAPGPIQLPVVFCPQHRRVRGARRDRHDRALADRNQPRLKLRAATVTHQRLAMRKA